MSKNLTNLLGQFRLLKDKYDAVAAATGERFNVFSVLDRERREVTTHSRLLAELLNPKGSHGCSAVFLRLFFEALDVKEAFRSDAHSDAQMANFQVTAEAWIGDGSIDILIEGNGKCIVIENKIGADDQERQLGRYYDYAVRKVGGDENANERIVVVYLTLDGRAPSDVTLGTNSDKQKFKLAQEDVLCVAYGTHIVKWLDSCIKETVRIPRIRETLVQYQSLVKKLTGQTMHRDFIMDTNALFSSSENYRLIPELEQAISAFKERSKAEFFRVLERDLRGKFDIQPDDTKDFDAVFVFDVIEINPPDLKIAVRVGTADRSLFYGFYLREKGGIIYDTERNKQHEKYREMVASIGLRNENWCLGWSGHKYGIDFKGWGADTIRQTATKYECEKIVGKLIGEMKYSVERFLGKVKS